MKEEFLSKIQMEVLDFTSSVETLANSIMILSTYYDLCIEDYEEFWRINSLVQDVVDELNFVMNQREKVMALFLD